MADPSIQALADQLLATIKGSLTDAARTFIEQNAPIKALLENRTLRTAELAKEYLTASDADKPTVAQYMTVVYQTIRNETLAVLLQAEQSVKDVILAALQSAFQFILQNLPAIIALIPK